MEHYVEIFAVISLFIMFAAIIVIVIFFSIKSRREYRRIKNISEYEGTVTDIEFIESHSNDGISGMKFFRNISLNQFKFLSFIKTAMVLHPINL